MAVYRRNFVGGRRIEPQGKRRCEVHSPFDGSWIGAAPLAERADIDLAVQLAREALAGTSWGKAPIEQRLKVVHRFLTLYADEAQSLVTLVTRENGIPLHFNLRLADETRMHSLAYIDAASTMGQPPRPPDRAESTLTFQRPCGVVAAFSSWNAPQRTALGWLVPALLAGCSVILALNPRTALDGQVIGELMEQAELPEGVLSILVTGQDTATYLAGHPAIDRIAFAGSSLDGCHIAGTATADSKRLTMEPRGRAPVIILPDADIAATTEGLRYASFFASGQWPVTQNRVFVPRHRQAELVECLRACVEAMPLGDPLDPGTFIGPLICAQEREILLRVIEQGCKDGAELVAGGAPLDMPGASGAFLLPTVIANATNTMEIARVPLRGPVVVTIPYRDIDDAIHMANGSGYGAAASIWTSDADLGVTVAGRLRAGTVSINGVAPSTAATGGGVWQGGVGGLDGARGILEFAEIQTVSR